MTTPSHLVPKANSDIAGLDHVLNGGWAHNRLHLLEGSPGTGKTTIAPRFLMAGANQGETGIYVSLAEPEQELREGAKSHGWVLGPALEVFELVPPESALDPDQQQNLLYASVGWRRAHSIDNRHRYGRRYLRAARRRPAAAA